MKKSGLRIAVIGAGSTYTPMIVQELAARSARLPVADLVFYDIDPGRLSIVSRFCRRLVGGDVPISSARTLRKAVEGADFVLSQFRVGGLQARHRDIRLGLRYGLIGQETTGVGGFAKALRTIPATLAVCRAVRRYAARDVWLVNFTNPSSIITEAVLKHGGVRCVGLCNGPWGMLKALADALKVDPADVELDYVGANHFSWVRGVRVKGKDWTTRARRAHARHLAANIPELKLDAVFERTVGLPYSGYLQYYYYTEKMLAKLRARKRTRAQEALAIERVLLRKYADERIRAIPEELSQRGGAGYNFVAANVIEAIANDLANLQIVNVANSGAVEGIERDAVLELTCRVSRSGAEPMPVGKVEARFRGLLQAVKAYEELAVEAGVKGDLASALQALVIHPLGPTADRATALLKDLLRINRVYLPQFPPAAVRRFFCT
ncbi:MAG: 6-phospho-beta-glucosidase [Planctomycetota bacterium]